MGGESVLQGGSSLHVDEGSCGGAVEVSAPEADAVVEAVLVGVEDW